MREADSQMGSHWDEIHARRRPDDVARMAYLTETIQVDDRKRGIRRREASRKAVAARMLKRGQRTLSKGDVIEIRKLRAQGMFLSEIAKRYGRGKGAISAVINRRSFRELEG